MEKAKHQKIEPLVDQKEICKITGLKASFIDKAQKNYGFPYLRIGRSLRYRVSQVENWINMRQHNR